ncbi:MAG: M24 family metallopeptidase [Steroidobacteraceae bacterium]
MPTRRSVIQAGLVAPVAAGHATTDGARPTPSPALPDLQFLRSEPLVNADRLRFFMQRDGLDAIVAAQPQNVFYLSNHYPQLDRMGRKGAGIAIFSADPHRPLTLVMPSFLYYYTHSPEWDDWSDRLVFPYTQPADPAKPPADGSEPEAAPGRVLRVRDAALITPRDHRRADALTLARPASADASWALAKALRELGLQKARVGIDDLELSATLGARGFAGTYAPAEDTLRWARLAKSPTELKLMRFAAQANVDAALAAAGSVRETGTTRALRARFHSEAAARGNLGVFMVINSSSTEVVDEPIRDGMAFAIDCVSHCRFYHGDFARTVFVGEPPESAKRATRALQTAWGDIRSRLRAGMRFADVSRIGRESLRKQGVDLNVSFTPHSVGLFHTDHPQASLLSPRRPEDLVLEENTVLSVDHPVMESGLGWTMHLEDLTLIRADGSEPLHSVPPAVLMV